MQGPPRGAPHPTALFNTVLPIPDGSVTPWGASHAMPPPSWGRRHVGVRLDAELEASLQTVARQAGCSLSAWVRQALRLYLRQFRDGEETRRQSRLVARLEAPDALAAVLPAWSDWT